MPELREMSCPAEWRNANEGSSSNMQVEAEKQFTKVNERWKDEQNET